MKVCNKNTKPNHELAYLQRPNERWCRILQHFSQMLRPSFLYVSLKRHNFFLFESYLDWESMLNPNFFFSEIPVFYFWLCLFPTIFYTFFKNDGFLRSKALIVLGNRQSSQIFHEMKSLHVSDAFFGISVLKVLQLALLLSFEFW